MTALENRLRRLPRPYLVESEIHFLFGGTDDSRYGKIKRLVQQGKLLRLRRGVYVLTKEVGHVAQPHPFELAQFIYGPSYISLESALSHHQLIPEAVYTTTSVTSKRATHFDTPLGRFDYLHLPQPFFYLGVERHEKNGNIFLIAKPWKALCDYVYCYKKDWKTWEPLIESLRIEPNDLPTLSKSEIEALKDYYQSQRINHFLNGLNQVKR